MSEKDVRVHIEEIRKQLWLGHASLMVGSGFSRNANKATPTTPTPPDWHGLADQLTEKLYPEASEKERAKILAGKTILRLAEEFDPDTDHTKLNAFLRDCIQDENLSPSALHIKMLELPWTDVFTTNYDTLLERAAQQILSPNYKVIVNCNDIPYSAAPRIIKLHGSFALKEPHLIVTEEDYRTYPQKFSPFVNTVQQKIMEGILCLIGFSGDDPNFLKWIGWVRDNLNESMPPIYLIGIPSHKPPELKWLERRNIIPIDLSLLPNISPGDYSKALSDFFSLLEVQEDDSDWRINSSLKYLSPKDDFSEETFIDVIKTWGEDRKTYPNWLTPPWAKRSVMVMFTERWTNNIDYLKKLPGIWDIVGLYELNWRLEKCLMPIFNNLIPVYESIVDKYDPFGLRDKKNTNYELQSKWLDLCFAILRWSREELNERTWNKYEAIIQTAITGDICSQNRLFHEQAFHALALPNLALVDEIMNQWAAIEHPLLWKVRMGSVLSIIGNNDKAHTLWEAALRELCPLRPQTDPYLLSIEGSILTNLCHLTLEQLKNPNKVQNREKYRARLRELESAHCNPWENLEKFSLALENQKKTDQGKQTSRDFKSKTSNVTVRCGWDPKYTQTFQHLRFFEETGIPFIDGKANKTLACSISYVADCSPAWAFLALNIIGSSNDASCELLFSQGKLYCINATKTNEWIDRYVPQVQYIITAQHESLSRSSNNFYTHISKNLVEVISRLTVKASPDNLKKILLLGVELYKIGDQVLFFQQLGSRYFKRVFDAMLPQQIFDNLDVLLSIPIPVPSKIFWESSALFVDWRNFRVSPKMCTTSLQEKIDSLISKLDTDDTNYRSNLLSYLNVCFEVNLLSASQKKRIAKTLQSHSTPGNLPSINHFYQFAYKRFLAPLNSKQEIEASLKEYYFRGATSLLKTENGKIVFQLFPDTDFIRMAHSLLATCSVLNRNEWMFFELSADECKKLFENLKAAWTAAKDDIVNILRSDSTSWDNRADVVRETLVYLDKILGEVVLPRVLRSDLFQQGLSFIQELDVCFPFPISAISACCNSKKYSSDLFVKILAGVNECDITKFESYSYSVFIAYRFASAGALPLPPLQWLDSLISVVHMKADRTFCTACAILGSIFKYHFPPKVERAILLHALRNLLNATSFMSSNDRFLMQDRYDYRQAATFLAAELYQMYQKRKQEIPSVLEEWHDLCKSPDELPDIRNTWMRV